MTGQIPKEHLASLNEAKKKIVNGTSVIFFPEGTRSKDGKVGEFKKGAFKMAFDLGLPILPVTIVGTSKILPAHTINLFPGIVHIYIHKPININQYTEDKIEELMDTTKSIMTSVLEQ